jgi:transcriptional regulator with XRE-family HTH domain
MSDLDYQKAFGRHLRLLREERNWTQDDLDAASKVSKVQISKLENGEDAPSLITIKKLALALGHHPSELLAFDFDLELNTNFPAETKRREKPGTTARVNELAAGDFFKTPRLVSAVIEKCREEFGVHLDSAAVSGALRKLVDSGVLKRVSSGSRGTFQYQTNK